MGPVEGTRWDVCMGLIFAPVLVRRLLGPLSLSEPMTSTYLTLIATPNGPPTHPHAPPTPTPRRV